ncbi:YheC/YheD family protein [Neobacillus drentensis]|uniref:YheC/YheD family protein n=1 Tax=Neobacillus drentensis TaxID=220684 RepID=UPI002FFFE783
MQLETADFGFIYHEKKQKQLFKLMIDQFRHLSKSKNIKIVLFTLGHLDLEELAVTGTMIAGDNISQGPCKVPAYIYNFALHSTVDKIDKMRNLRKLEAITVINPVNRFIQGIIFEMLASCPSFRPYLLPSKSFNTSTFIDYDQKYDTFFLLPENSFLPPKAVVIKKFQNNDYMIYIGQNGQLRKEDDLVSYIKKMINKKKYIIFKGIEHLRIGNDPLETKILLQKSEKGEWCSTVIAVKKGIFSRKELSYSKSNDATGDLISPVNEEQLSDISIQIGRFLDFYIPFIGSYTFDFIFDENNCPYLIHISGFEQDQNFFQLLDFETQLTLLNNSFNYLYYQRNNFVTKRVQPDGLDQS